MRRERRPYIDYARGLAVLLMIEAHTTDAWTRVRDKGTFAYGVLTILGGFAAPLFLWLAGLGVAMAAASIADRSSRRNAVDALTRRGLEIFILAFLFRLQAFILSPGSSPVMLFRVDVLNVMGPAMVVSALLWPLIRDARARTALYAAAATAVALATPVVRASPLVDLLPTWVQWYLRPAGEFTTFTLFPWAGFVFAGAAAGALIADADARAEARLHAGLGAAAIVLIGGAYLASMRPTIYTVPVSFWTSSPTWFALRTGVLMLTLAALWVLPLRSDAALARLGRASLFVYWIHVELVYGYASWLWRHRLPVWASLLACAAFASLMYAAVVARDRYLARRPIRIPHAAALPQA
jgi:uncharacterized membrane protein